jgi:hypothetical protein
MNPKVTSHSRIGTCEKRNHRQPPEFRRSCWGPQFKKTPCAKVPPQPPHRFERKPNAHVAPNNPPAHQMPPIDTNVHIHTTCDQNRSSHEGGFLALSACRRAKCPITSLGATGIGCPKQPCTVVPCPPPATGKRAEGVWGRGDSSPPSLRSIVPAVRRPKSRVFLGNHAPHFKTALGGASHLQKMPCFPDPNALQTTKTPPKTKTVPPRC